MLSDPGQTEDADAVKGTLIEWGGIDHSKAWRQTEQAVCKLNLGDLVPTHLLLWDSGHANVIAMKKSGWAVLDTGRCIRLSGLGNRQYILEEHNRFRCSRCGDVLEDERALLFHQTTGFCRVNKSIHEQRTLRVARQVEAKKKQEKEVEVERADVWHGGQQIATVKSFTYLGTEIDHRGTTHHEVQRRCAIAMAAVKALGRVWRDKEIERHLRASLYRSLCLSIALYNAETWAVTEADAQTLRRIGSPKRLSVTS
ncbi:unnamed protein product [Amoebophrya sp. A120]|nr:unnamed protein product [Amoebophrya sp. A120]|eukprot:GSA120T00020860001.1